MYVPLVMGGGKSEGEKERKKAREGGEKER